MVKKEDIFEKVPDWIKEQYSRDKEPDLWTEKKWEDLKDTHPLPYLAYDKEEEMITILTNVHKIVCRSSPSYQEYPLECYIGQQFNKDKDSEFYGKVINEVGAVLIDKPIYDTELYGDTGGDYIYSTVNFTEPTKCKIGIGNFDHIIIHCEPDPRPIELRLELTRPKKRK